MITPHRPPGLLRRALALASSSLAALLLASCASAGAPGGAPAGAAEAGVAASDPPGVHTPAEPTPAEICGCAADMPGCLCAHCLGMPEACPCHDEEGNLKPEACREAQHQP